MKKIDLIFALVCGFAVAWVAGDFFKIFGWAFFILLPLLFVILVDVIERIFKNSKIVGQGIRHIFTGAFADIADIKFFQLLFWFFPDQLTVKAISFLLAAVIKYLGNKYWAFDKPGKDGSGLEALQFLAITLVGLLINVASFYFFVRINPGLSPEFWREISVILALIITAFWNFCGYKFIVFKK
jgi:putative flippase GtrA